jgi:hypothetical protein
MAPASSKLADELIVVPYPFVGKERQEIEAEFATLLRHGVPPNEVAEIVLYALEILLHNRKITKHQNTYDRITFEISDMLGRLLVFEEMFPLKKQK